MSKPEIGPKRHAPPDVQRLIELANSVPAELDLPPPQGRVEEIVELLRTEPFRHFRDLSGPVEPDTFLTKLVGPEAPKTYNRVMGNYIRLRDGRNWLRQAALIGKLSVDFRKHYLMPLVSVQTNDRGGLEFNIDPLVRALEGVEAIRIRVCPICAAIFWAPRKDKPCCTIRCAQILRTRRWRGKYLGQYKHQRLTRTQASSEMESKAQLAKEDRERARLKSLKASEPNSRRRAARPAQGDNIET